MGYLGALSDNVTSEVARTTHIEHYVETILDLSRRRQSLAAANALAAATEDPGMSTDECLQQIQESLLCARGSRKMSSVAETDQ